MRLLRQSIGSTIDINKCILIPKPIASLTETNSPAPRALRLPQRECAAGKGRQRQARRSGQGRQARQAGAAGKGRRRQARRGRQALRLGGGWQGRQARRARAGRRGGRPWSVYAVTVSRPLCQAREAGAGGRRGPGGALRLGGGWQGAGADGAGDVVEGVALGLGDGQVAVVMGPGGED